MPSDSPSPLPAFSDEPIVATIVQRAVSNETSTPALASPKPSELASQRSGFEAFFDSFFRRENIRWLAVIGAAIVIASSLMMVTREWSNWPVTAKFFVILGYTGVIYLFSEFGRKQLGLQITARVCNT